MKKTILEKTADKLANAFVNNKIIAPLPIRFTKTLSEAQKLRKLCESKVKDPIIGFKAAFSFFLFLSLISYIFFLIINKKS